jgi:hypothetical protein
MRDLAPAVEGLQNCLMIIELYGPPGRRATTFARALVTALQARGHFTDLLLSARPAQAVGAEGSCPVAASRPSRLVLIDRLASRADAGSVTGADLQLVGDGEADERA